MEFRFGPEEEAFRQEVVNFFKEIAFPPGWRAYYQLDLGTERMSFIRGLAQRLGKRGWLSLAWPRQYGGREAPILDAILAEETVYHGVMYARDGDTAAAAMDIIHFGTQEQKRKYLPPIARGELFWSIGLTEPGAGSDLASVQLRAEERDDHFLLQGQKMFTSNAHNAGWILVLVRTDPQATPRYRGLSFFLVDMKSPGITVRPLTTLNNTQPFNEVFFDRVKVPRENLLGEKHRGFYMAMMALEQVRFGWDLCPGNGRRVLEQLLAYARGKRIKEELRHRLAELAIKLEVARWFYYRAFWLQARKLPFSLEPSIAKLFISEFHQRLYQVGMEMLGLYCQLRDESRSVPLAGEMAYLYFDSVKDTIIDGTSEIQRNIIATRGLGLPRG